MKAIKLLFIIIFAISFSCTDKNNPLISSNDGIVIQGYLVADKPVNDIKITKPAPYTDQDAQTPISDADVIISRNREQYKLIANSEKKGYYYYPNDDLMVTAGDTFKLHVSYNNTISTAETIVPGKPKITFASRDTLWLYSSYYDNHSDSCQVTFKWETPGYSKAHYITFLDNTYSSHYSFSNTWELENSSFDDFWTMQSKTYNNLLFFNSKEGPLDFSVYNVNEEYLSFITSTQIIDNKLQEIKSNVHNGYGIFTALNSDSYTIYLKKANE